MNVIGTVSFLSGKAVAIKADGTERQLMLGDEVYADEMVKVSLDSAIEIAMEGGDPVRLDGGQNWLASSETFTEAEDFDLSEAVTGSESIGDAVAGVASEGAGQGQGADVDAIQAAILAGQDPTEVAEATAAGAGGDAAGGNEGTSTVVLDRTAGEVDPNAGYDTIGFSDTFEQPQEELLGAPDLTPDLTPPVDYDADVIANFVEELPFSFDLNWNATSIDVTVDETTSVAYVYFSVDSDTAIYIETDGPTIDPQIHLFHDDGNLDLGDWLATDDDDGPAAGFFSNSIIETGDEVGVLPAGDYVIAVSDFSLSDSEAVSGDNLSSLGGRSGEVTMTIAASSAEITINDGTTADPASAVSGSLGIGADLGAYDGGFLYEFQVGESEVVSDNIHGTDQEDGVTSNFTITSMPVSSGGEQVGYLLIDRNDDGTIEEVYGEEYGDIPAGGLNILSGDSVYYFQSPSDFYEPEYDGEQGPPSIRASQESEFSPQPVPVSFTYLTTDSDGMTSDGAVISIGFPVIPEPSVVLAGGDVRTVIIDEDGSAAISVSADTNDGSHLTTMTISGFNPAVTSDWFDLSGLEASGATASFSGGVLTITGLSGTSFDGSFTITPTADSDIDPGGLGAEVVAISDADAGIENVAFTFLPVLTNAVLDQFGDVDATAQTGTESTSGTQTLSLGTSMSVADAFQTGDVDGDGSETITASLTLSGALPAGAVLSSTAGTVTLDSGNTYTVTAAPGSSLSDAVTGLQVTVAEGWDGTISGSIDSSAVDAVTGGSDVETDTSDNTKTDTANFSLVVSGGTSAPTVDVNLANNNLVIKEDGTGSFTVTATVGDNTDVLTQIAVGNLPASATVTSTDGGTYSGGVYTVNGSHTTLTLTIGNLSPTADSDVDLGDITFVATAKDATDTSAATANSAQATATVTTDAVLDEGVDVTQTSVPEHNADTDLTALSLNLDATLVNNMFTGSNDGGTDSDGSESVTAIVTLTAGTLSDADGSFTGTAAQVVSWLEGLTVDGTGVAASEQSDASVTGTVSITATDTATDSEITTSDNSYTSNGGVALNFTVNIDSVPHAVDDYVELTEGASTTTKNDVVLVIDRSGSMSGEMATLKSAVQDLFNSGTVNSVFITSFAGSATFSNSGVNGGWYTDLTSAMGAVNALNANGSTDYDAGLSAVTSNFTAPPVGGDKLISVFMSDGEPNDDNDTGSDGIIGAEETAWYNFLADPLNEGGNDPAVSFDASYAVGFTGLDNSDRGFLEPIAWTPGEVNSTNGALDDSNVLILNSASDLSDALVEIVRNPPTFEGNVLTSSLLNDDPGADGFGTPKVIGAFFDGSPYAFDSGTTSHTIDLGPVGSLLLNSDGTFTFTGPSGDIVNDLSAQVTYTIQDADGDTSSAVLTLAVKDSVPVAYDNTTQAVVTEVLAPAEPSTTILANFSDTTNSASSGSGYNKWIFDSDDSGNVSGDERTVQFGVTPLNAPDNMWGVDNDSDNGYVDTSGNGRLYIDDNNDDTAALATPSFVIANGETGQFSFLVRNDDINGNDSASWELIQKNGGTYATVSQSGSISENGTITISNIQPGTYRLHLQVTDGARGDAQFSIDNLTLAITGQPTLQVITTSVSGNVLVDPNTLLSSSDPWGAVDDQGADGAALQVWNGSAFVDAASTGTTIVGLYGSLTIEGDGDYTYTPDADLSNIGEQDVFTYQLAQPDGDTDSAELVITIGSAPYSAPVPIVGDTGTSGDDVILGGDGIDTLYGAASDDHIEGGAGDDVIRGGTGNDILIGDEGDDEFVWTVADADGGVDTVADFAFNLTDPNAENDVLDLTDLLDGTGNVITAAEVDGHLQLTITDASNVVQQVVDLDSVAVDAGNVATVYADLLANGNIEVDNS